MQEIVFRGKFRSLIGSENLDSKRFLLKCFIILGKRLSYKLITVSVLLEFLYKLKFSKLQQLFPLTVVTLKLSEFSLLTLCFTQCHSLSLSLSQVSLNTRTHSTSHPSTKVHSTLSPKLELIVSLLH